MLIPAAPEREEPDMDDGYGFVLLEVLSKRGWSACVEANGLGGVLVTIMRDDDEIAASAPSVNEAAPKLFFKAMGFRTFAGSALA